MLTYRKTRDGNWAAFGPQAEVREGPVVIKKKDGSTKQETVKHVSRPFMVDGIPHCYGFLEAPARNTGTGGRRPRESGYCYYPCPVTGRTCNPENGPCHDCE